MSSFLEEAQVGLVLIDTLREQGCGCVHAAGPICYAEMVRAFVQQHGSITPRECRELLGLGESQSARVEVSRYLGRWSKGEDAFLRREGNPPKVKYHRA